MGSNPAQSLKIFSGLCSSSVTVAFALITIITHLLLMDNLLSKTMEFEVPVQLYKLDYQPLYEPKGCIARNKQEQTITFLETPT